MVRIREHTTIEKPQSWKQMSEKYEEHELTDLIDSAAVTEVLTMHGDSSSSVAPPLTEVHNGLAPEIALRVMP